MDYFEISSEADEHFPSHGWLKSLNGIRFLRLPVLRLYQGGQPTFERFTENNLGGVWLQLNSPYRTLRQLAIGLRDLHRETREVLSTSREEWLTRESSRERNLALTGQQERYERIEILMIAVIILLRRLGDELITASGPFLFQHWKSAPKKLMDAADKARKGTLAKNTKPICDFDVLNDALQNHTGWLAQLRQANGIRDILVHWPHFLQINSLGTREPNESETRWRVVAQLYTIRPGEIPAIDLFPKLIECVSGACRFMDRLYRCATPIDQYEQRDLLYLTGSDNDIVGFWPSVQDVLTEFPLHS